MTDKKTKKTKHVKKHLNKKMAIVPLGYGAIAPRLKATLNYFETFALTATTGIYNTFLYNLNSLFDPNRTGAGHQPLGFDQLTTLYNRYRVDSCKWDVQCTLADTYTAYTAMATVGPQNSTGLATYITDQEQPHIKTKLIGLAGGPIASFHGSQNIGTLVAASTTSYKSDDRYSALMTLNPSELCTLLLGVNNIQGNTIQVIWRVKLAYTAEFFDPNVIVGS